MILITTAMRAEAKPLIEALELSSVSDTTPPIYANDGIALVIGGVGRVRAASTIGYCFGKIPQITAVLNVGVAGATTLAVGEIFWVNAITDVSTRHRHYPDMMVELDIAEAELTTHDAVQADGEFEGLVDMEGAAVYEAASRYLSPHRIGLLKVVSDLCDGVTPNAPAIGKLITDRLPEILKAVHVYHTMSPDKLDPIVDHLKLLDALTASLRLTASQRVRLEDVLRDRLLNMASTVPDLNDFLADTVTTKQEGKVRFERLVRTLLDA